METDESFTEKASKYASMQAPHLTRRGIQLFIDLIKATFKVITEMIGQALGK